MLGPFDQVPTAGVKHFSKSAVSTRNLLVLKNCLLVLNIGMEEIKFVEHKINSPLLSGSSN